MTEYLLILIKKSQIFSLNNKDMLSTVREYSRSGYMYIRLCFLSQKKKIISLLYSHSAICMIYNNHEYY